MLQEVECIALDSFLAASSCLGGEIRVWELASGRCLRRICRWSSHGESRKVRAQSIPVQRHSETDGLKHRGTSLPDRGLDVENCVAAGEMNVAGISDINGRVSVIQSETPYAEIPWSLTVGKTLLAVGYGDGVIEVRKMNVLCVAACVDSV